MGLLERYLLLPFSLQRLLVLALLPLPARHRLLQFLPAPTLLLMLLVQTSLLHLTCLQMLLLSQVLPLMLLT